MRYGLTNVNIASRARGETVFHNFIISDIIKYAVTIAKD